MTTAVYGAGGDNQIGFVRREGGVNVAIDGIELSEGGDAGDVDAAVNRMGFDLATNVVDRDGGVDDMNVAESEGGGHVNGVVNGAVYIIDEPPGPFVFCFDFDPRGAGIDVDVDFGKVVGVGCAFFCVDGDFVFVPSDDLDGAIGVAEGEFGLSGDGVGLRELFSGREGFGAGERGGGESRQ